ncbi:MAG: translation elongation factor-like protein [Candidatus Levybacteria bacterium]|nr:translation elongation factor-like protein [Candidatus Levybacteria bacterium]
MNDQIGKVVHYYDRIGVAVVKLGKKLKVGDKVKFSHGEDSFEQQVSSMQLDHKPINEASKGDEVAIKVDKSAKEGTVVVR